MSNEVYIDGVNVAGCINITQDLWCEDTADLKCEEYPNCYFKQLQRAKAELNKYKTEIMTLRKGYDEEDCTTTCPEIQRLSKELDNYRRVD